MIPENERYEMIFYAGVLNEDSTLKMGIPLYVRITGDMSAEQENLIKQTASTLVSKYRKEISAHIEKLKNGGRNDENNKTKIQG